VNRIALLAILLVTACAPFPARAEEKPAPAPPAEPLYVIYNVPLPIRGICGAWRVGDKVELRRMPELESLSCEQFQSLTQAVIQRYGPGATSVHECLLADRCAAAKAEPEK